MMKTLISRQVLSAVLIATAFAAIGAAPASAQALSHDGSLLPHYYDKNGELKWGGWAPQASEQKAVAVAPSHKLYLSAKHGHRRDLHS